MLIIVGFIWYTAAQPQISADGETLTLTGQTIAFEVDGGRTTVETLLNKGYDKATMDEMINELRSDMKTIVDANSDKVTKLESMLASTKAELDTAKQERDEMAGKLRLLQAHADSDCRADQVGFFFDAAQVWEAKHHMGVLESQGLPGHLLPFAASRVAHVSGWVAVSLSLHLL